jgi:DNA-binding Xre family transcriptional regulator
MMTNLSLQQFTQSARSAGTATKFIHTSQHSATDLDMGNCAPGTEDDLDSLIRSLSEKSPQFAEHLMNTRKKLAPLATDLAGRHTFTSLRMATGLTQRDLAEKIGQQQSNISLLESGQRTDIKRQTMIKLCNALSCDMNTLNDAIDMSEQLLQERHVRQEKESASQVSEHCLEDRRCA